MSLFSGLGSSLGKSLSNAGQNVVKQTKTFADTTQYNTSIMDRKKQISKIYAEIGESYYLNHRDDIDAEEQGRIDRINALNLEIEELEDKIREAKGYTRCPNCGAEVAVNMTFCNSCGTRMIPEVQASAEKPAGKICPNCGASVSDDSLFCTKCGTKLDVQTEGPLNQPVRRICRSCGAELAQGDVFCTSCGARVEEEVSGASSVEEKPDAMSQE